jgi:hypothetical protein
MPDPVQFPECRRCGRPVRVSSHLYDVFEEMHWVCFHFEFEHELSDADPDEPCADPFCPSARATTHIGELTGALRSLTAEWQSGPPSTWNHHALPNYLRALVAWLEDSDMYYARQNLPAPSEVVGLLVDGVREARTYG